MHALTALFLLVVVAKAGTRLWLANRQIAAARAHRSRVPAPFEDRISAADHETAADYTIARSHTQRVAAIVGAAVVLLLTLGGGVNVLDDLWRQTRLEQPWLGAAMLLTLLGLLKLVQLPLALWRTFGIEKRFGFNRTTPRLFAADLAKRTLLGTAVMAPLIVGALVIMERGGSGWWLVAWLGWVLATLTLTWAWPRFIAPLFNRFTPLADDALAKRVEALLARCGFAANGVFVMDGSRRSAHGNAYFTGVGRNKRIVFFDTLLEKLRAAEVEAVLAHELGHFRLHHVRLRLIVSLAAALGSLALLAWLARQPEFYAMLGVQTPSAHTALALFMLAAPEPLFFLTPATAWWSRRHELAADDFAVRYTAAADLSSALVKIYTDNAANLTPDPIASAFYDSHPPAPIRIARLESWKKGSEPFFAEENKAVQNRGRARFLP